MSEANLAKEHYILHYKIHLKWSFLVCSKLRNRVPKFVLLCKRSHLWLRMFKGEKEKKYESQIVPLFQGKGIAIGAEYETGIAKIGNQVKVIISTQL